MNRASWILLFVLLLAAGFALRAIKRRKGGCGCECSDCPYGKEKACDRK